MLAFEEREDHTGAGRAPGPGEAGGAKHWSGRNGGKKNTEPFFFSTQQKKIQDLGSECSSNVPLSFNSIPLWKASPSPTTSLSPSARCSSTYPNLQGKNKWFHWNVWFSEYYQHYRFIFLNSSLSSYKEKREYSNKRFLFQDRTYKKNLMWVIRISQLKNEYLRLKKWLQIEKKKSTRLLPAYKYKIHWLSNRSYRQYSNWSANESLFLTTSSH